VFADPAGELGAQVLAEEMGISIRTTKSIRHFALSRKPRHVLSLFKFVRSTGAKCVNIHFGNNRISIWDCLAIRLAGARTCIASVHHAAPFKDRRARTLTRLASRLCSHVVVTTPVLTQILSEAGVERSKIVEIPIGLTPPTYTPSRDEARKELRLPNNALVVASLGRLQSSKGFDDLIAAVSLATAGYRPVHLVIGGEGPLKENLRKWARERLGERGHVLGHIDRPEILYAACDLMCLASHEEGFGLVFMEAAFQGVPSVAYNVGGVPYAIKHEHTGFLVPDGNCLALSEAIEILLRDEVLRNQMGKAARDRGYKEYSESLMTERYSKLLA